MPRIGNFHADRIRLVLMVRRVIKITCLITDNNYRLRGNIFLPCLTLLTQNNLLWLVNLLPFGCHSDQFQRRESQQDAQEHGD